MSIFDAYYMCLRHYMTCSILLFIFQNFDTSNAFLTPFWHWSEIYGVPYSEFKKLNLQNQTRKIKKTIHLWLRSNICNYNYKEFNLCVIDVFFAIRLLKKLLSIRQYWLLIVFVWSTVGAINLKYQPYVILFVYVLCQLTLQICAL